jgi:hypothetical protein
MPDDESTGRPDSSVHRDPNAAYSARSDEADAERFSEGQETESETESKEHLGDFAEGQATDAGAHKTEEERFSEGQESEAETPEKEHKGSFAEGQEVLDDDEDR